MPYVFNRAYYDTCTRAKVDGSLISVEEFYWCPDPQDVDKENNNEFQANGKYGKCHDFLKPPGTMFVISKTSRCSYSLFLDGQLSSYHFNRCCKGFALSTADNGCQEHYEPAGDLCIRASIFPETYENAQSRCQSDGGYLLSITTSEIQVIKGEKFINIINRNILMS